jgi:hypothetical protein
MKTFNAMILLGLMAVVPAPAFDPNSVDSGTRYQWCVSQVSACTNLCEDAKAGDPTTNGCDPNTLSYSCVCQDGSSPNASEYSQTIPYFICSETNNQCVSNCGQDNTCSNACRADNPCGAQDPTRINATTSATAAATSGGQTVAGGVVHTGFGGAAVTGTPGANGKKSAAVSTVQAVGQVYGMGVVVASILAGFFFVLQ